MGFQVEKGHQVSCLLGEYTWRRILAFLIILIGVKVIKMAIVDFALSKD